MLCFRLPGSSLGTAPCDTPRKGPPFIFCCFPPNCSLSLPLVERGVHQRRLRRREVPATLQALQRVARSHGKIWVIHCVSALYKILPLLKELAIWQPLAVQSTEATYRSDTVPHIPLVPSSTSTSRRIRHRAALIYRSAAAAKRRVLKSRGRAPILLVLKHD